MLQKAPFWPRVAYALMLLALIILLRIAAHLVGERHKALAANQPFESDIETPHGFAHQGFLTWIITFSRWAGSWAHITLVQAHCRGAHPTPRIVTRSSLLSLLAGQQWPWIS